MAATHSTVRSEREHVEPTGWVGWIAFGGIMMLLLGMFHGFQGFVALVSDDYYAVTKNGLMVHVDYTTWGWVQMGWGVIVMATGVGLFAGQMWARILGVLIVSGSALINIAFMSAAPLWSSMMLVLDVLVIYAIVAHGREIRYES